MNRFTATNRIALFFGVVLISVVSLSQQAPPTKVIGTGTRQVAQFSALESELISAVQQGDQARLSKLLAEDFEEWTPDSNQGPTPREEWLTQHTGKRYASFRLRNMAVHTFGTTDVVSFVLRLEPAGSGPVVESFIVDVWTPAPDNSGSQIRVRYASRASGFKIPRTTKPTGKE